MSSRIALLRAAQRGHGRGWRAAQKKSHLNYVLKCFAGSGPGKAKSCWLAANPKLTRALCPATPLHPPRPSHHLLDTNTQSRAHTGHSKAGQREREKVVKYLAESNLQKSLIGPSYQEAERMEKNMLAVVRTAGFIAAPTSPQPRRVLH